MLPDIVISLRCSKCKKWKSSEKFYCSERTKKNLKQKGFSYYCKQCNRKASKDNYSKDAKLHIERAEKSKRKRKKRNKDFIVSYLINNPCLDCGEADPIVLDFDHVRGIKKHTVSDIVRDGGPMNRILEEIKKCEVVCANCHRRRTAKRGNWWNYG